MYQFFTFSLGAYTTADMVDPLQTVNTLVCIWIFKTKVDIAIHLVKSSRCLRNSEVFAKESEEMFSRYK